MRSSQTLCPSHAPSYRKRGAQIAATHFETGNSFLTERWPSPVYGSRLENGSSCEATVGSNPTISAISLSGGSSDGRAGGLQILQGRWFKSSSPVQFNAGVAQLVEQPSPKRSVVGSIPSPCANFPLQCGYIRRESGLKKPRISRQLLIELVPSPRRPEPSTQGGKLFEP